MTTDRRPWRLRSLLFVPGNRPDRIDKAVRSGADAVIADLEDAVAAGEVAAARVAIVDRLAASADAPVRRVVRVNGAGDPDHAGDVAATMGTWLDAVMLPKTDEPDEVAALDVLLEEAERREGVESGSVGIIPLVESCRGLRAAFDIAVASPRVVAMALSSGEEGDFIADLGGRWTPDGAALHHARSRFLVDVRAAGVDVVVDGVCVHLDDERVLVAESTIAATLGYDGKLAIHPAQLPVIHEAFTPGSEEVAAARRLLEAFESARAAGEAVVRHEGRMIDAANVRVARRLLFRAGVDPT